MSDVEVVIVRLKSNEELIGIAGGVKENKLFIEFPHYIKFISKDNSFGIMPYCPFSDQVEYIFKVEDVQFMVSAKKIVQQVFINKIMGIKDEDDQFDEVPTIQIEGNQTYH